MSSPPDFLAVGHVTIDEHVDASGATAIRPGGAAAFAALTARNLGLRAAVVTSAAPDFDVAENLPGVETRVVPARQTTRFRNAYDSEGGRWQWLLARASDIRQDDIPANWRHAPVVFLGPLAGEVPADAPGWFPGAMVAAATQGWLRTWDARGVVDNTLGPPQLPPGLLRLLTVSDSELGGADPAPWLRLADVVGVTRGNLGVSLYNDGSARDVPACPVDHVVDPTGAGDVWTAACLIALQEGVDVAEAARFANAVASIAIQAPGLRGIPDRQTVEERLRQAS